MTSAIAASSPLRSGHFKSRMALFFTLASPSGRPFYSISPKPSLIDGVLRIEGILLHPRFPAPGRGRGGEGRALNCICPVTALIGTYGLPHPPDGIGCELIFSRVVELLDRLHEAYVAFLK